MIRKILTAVTLAVMLTGIILCVPVAESSTTLTNSEGFVYKVKEDGTIIIVGYTGNEKDIVIPETIDSTPVTEIGTNSFSYSNTAKNVTIPGCIKVIGVCAFEYCGKLTSVNILEGVEEIKDSAFYGCHSLTEITIPKSISKAGYGIISLCDKLKTAGIAEEHPYFTVQDNVLFTKPDHRLIWYPMQKKDKEYSVPDGTEIIDSNAFHGSAVTSINLPESVNTIKKRAFAFCSRLKRINIPIGVTTLRGIFDFCSQLEVVEIPEEHPNLFTIDGVIFSRETMELIMYPSAKKGKSYTVPEGTTKICCYAFEYSQLISVEIPGSVKIIEHNAFLHAKIKTIILHEGVETFDAHPFQWCESLTEINIPTTLVNITRNPFRGCKKLETVKIADGNPVLTMIDGILFDKSTNSLIWCPVPFKANSYTVPEGTEHILDSAFYLTKLSELIFPEGVKDVTMCNEETNLKRVVLPASVESIHVDTFDSPRYLQGITFVVIQGSFAENYCQAYQLTYEYAE